MSRVEYCITHYQGDKCVYKVFALTKNQAILKFMNYLNKKKLNFNLFSYYDYRHENLAFHNFEEAIGVIIGKYIKKKSLEHETMVEITEGILDFGSFQGDKKAYRRIELFRQGELKLKKEEKLQLFKLSICDIDKPQIIENKKSKKRLIRWVL